MAKVELDTIRKLLQGALRNLGDDSVVANLDSAPIAVLSSQTEAPPVSGTPLVIVVTSELQAAKNQQQTNQSFETLNTIPSQCGCNEKKVSHPGLERFTIDPDTQTSAPKSCFMEPDRLCVNSGACEMRGY
jgi:hypothetical protein